MVVGSPSIAVRICRKSHRCSGSSASSACVARLVVLGQDQPLDVLAPLAEEHVLGAAQADALAAEPAGPLGVLDRVGVRPHPQPAHAVGPAHHPVHRPHQVVGLGRGRGRGCPRVLDDRGRHDRHLAGVDHARWTRRRRSRRPRGPRCRPGRSTGGVLCRRRAPRRRTRTSCPSRGRPPRRGWSSRRGWSGCPRRRSCRSGRPGWSPGAPGRPSPRPRTISPPCRSRTPPCRPPHPARRTSRPRREPCRSCAVSNRGNISCTSWSRTPARTASSASITPSSTSWVAIRNAAPAVRLPTRVCSIHSVPRSMVNSMSHRSR